VSGLICRWHWIWACSRGVNLWISHGSRRVPSAPLATATLIDAAAACHGRVPHHCLFTFRRPSPIISPPPSGAAHPTLSYHPPTAPTSPTTPTCPRERWLSPQRWRHITAAASPHHPVSIETHTLSSLATAASLVHCRNPGTSNASPSPSGTPHHRPPPPTLMGGTPAMCKGRAKGEPVHRITLCGLCPLSSG